MNLLKTLFARSNEPEITRYTVTDYANWLANNWPIMYGQTYNKEAEQLSVNFETFSEQVYKKSSVVAATVEVRRAAFSQIEFVWQNTDRTSTSFRKLFGNQELSVLEVPWPNGSTASLLSRMEQDVSLVGNAYVVRENNRLRRLRPDWVAIQLNAPPTEAVRSDIIGYQYFPGGINSGVEPEVYMVEEIAHWAPVPDPMAQYMGLSWIQSILLEIQADQAASQHKLNFFHNGATLQTVISPKDEMSQEQFDEFKEFVKTTSQGTHNAYKPLYLTFGADVRVVSADINQIDFRSTQGRDETRIALAGRVPPTMLGISEGLQGASLNAGNFKSARRSFVDLFLWEHWASACTALQSILDVPAKSRLWFDTTDIPLLREDQLDAAEIFHREISAITMAVREGYEADSITAATKAKDPSLLKHTGYVSVQLWEPGSRQVHNPDQPQGEPQQTTPEQGASHGN